jgi:hypothetical protein
MTFLMLVLYRKMNYFMKSRLTDATEVQEHACVTDMDIIVSIQYRETWREHRPTRRRQPPSHTHSFRIVVYCTP